MLLSAVEDDSWMTARPVGTCGCASAHGRRTRSGSERTVAHLLIRLEEREPDAVPLERLPQPPAVVPDNARKVDSCAGLLRERAKRVSWSVERGVSEESEGKPLAFAAATA